MSFKYKILSIDGGGIRGIIPAMIIAEIEARTRKPISQLFDMIAGTSTGGILALGLTKPDPYNPNQPHYTAGKLIDLYRQEGKRIFKQPCKEKISTLQKLFRGTKCHCDREQNILQKYSTPWPKQIFELFRRAKYHSDGREAVLREYLGNTTLLENALTKVFITSYDTEHRMPVFFCNEGEEKTNSLDFRQIYKGITMLQAGMATSAAPTYFEPYPILTDHTRNGFYSLIDGGVFANNPTSLAIMESILASKKKAKYEVKNKNSGKKTLSLDEILVVSIGTGSLTRAYSYKEVKDWKNFRWLEPLINIVMDGQSEAIGCQLDQFLPDAESDPKQYYRFQVRLTEGNDNIDDPSADNIKKLEQRAKLLIETRTKDLDDVCNLLLNTPTVAEREKKNNDLLLLGSHDLNININLETVFYRASQQILSPLLSAASMLERTQ